MTNRPSACPNCGAPTGSAASCEFCGSPLSAVPAQVSSGHPNTPSDAADQPGALEDWMNPAPDPALDLTAPAPRWEQPYQPPAPSGLEPISMVLNEAARTGQSILRRTLTACLSGCVVALIAFLGCGLVSYLLLDNRMQASRPIVAALIGLTGAFLVGLGVSLVVFLRRK